MSRSQNGWGLNRAFILYVGLGVQPINLNKKNKMIWEDKKNKILIGYMMYINTICGEGYPFPWGKNGNYETRWVEYKESLFRWMAKPCNYSLHL